MKRDKFKLLKPKDLLGPAQSEQAKKAKKIARRVIAGRPFENEAELAEKIEVSIYEYAGVLSNAAVLGVLDIVRSAITATMVDDLE